ncbi:MAG: MarC family protein [Nitrospirae bacterium]|nr:MarC family protein [Nitrospirota bacterium]MBI4837813.1 MarC family protein [Nitrospirota bacterium]
MSDILQVLPITFIPIFVAIDIFAVLPIFISVTGELRDTEKKTIIRHSIITALLVSIAFVAVGEVVFRILGITVADFKIAGGLVLLVIAVLDLLRFGAERRKVEDAVGVVPIGVPLIVGPAVLTTLLVLIDHYGIIPTVISLVLNLLIVWFSFVKAEAITRIIGKNGIVAISKVMAILLASIAVMMIRIGIENLIK